MHDSNILHLLSMFFKIMSLYILDREGAQKLEGTVTVPTTFNRIYLHTFSKLNSNVMLNV
jgi:hypothetical protein